MEKQARRGIAGDVDVRPAIVIEVRRSDGKSVASFRLTNSGRDSDIGKSAIAVIVIETVTAINQTTRPAEDSLEVTTLGCTGARHAVHVEGNVVREEEVQPAIPVIIHEPTSRTKARFLIPEPGRLRHIGESAVAVVAVKGVLGPAGDE